MRVSVRQLNHQSRVTEAQESLFRSELFIILFFIKQGILCFDKLRIFSVAQKLI